MSTVPTVPDAPVAPIATKSKFVSLLDHAGVVIKKFFSKELPFIDDVAEAAVPIVSLAIPNVAPLFESIVAMVKNAEAAGLAASANGSTSTQKLASVVAAVEPIATAWAADNKLALTTSHITAAVNAAVAFLQAFPAPSDSPALNS